MDIFASSFLDMDDDNELGDDIDFDLVLISCDNCESAAELIYTKRIFFYCRIELLDYSANWVNQYAYWRGQELIYLIEALEKFDYVGEENINQTLIEEVQKELNLKYDLANSFK